MWPQRELHVTVQLETEQRNDAVYVFVEMSAASSHSGTSLTVRAVVQAHRQLARSDTSLNLLLPVVHQ